MAQKEDKEKQDRYTPTEIVTQTEPAVRDNETNETLTQYEAVLRLLNICEEIKKNLT